MNNSSKTLYLVDGSSYLYRAFHALPALSNSAGEPTGALYGVANMLRRMLREYDPDYMAVIFDAKGKTFRHELYPEYKATRPPMPADLSSQVQPILELVEALGLPLLQVTGVEADDVIGTLAIQAKKQGMHCVISTGDKDIAQLVDEQVSLINTMTETAMDRQGVIDKFGVPPERIIDYLALIGDKSDNVPGVNKVGPKTAVKWLAEYHDLDGLVAHAGEIGGKVGEYLRDGLEQLPKSKDLVTIRTNVDLDLEPADLRIEAADEKRLEEIFKRYEFSSWLKEMGAEGQPKPETKGQYRAILEQAEFDSWVQKLAAADLVAVDTETTSINYMNAELVGFSFAVKPGEAVYIPVGHTYPGAPEQLPLERVLEAIKPVLEDPTLPKVGQHLKYDMNILQRYGINVQGVQFDTMLESYVLDATGTRHDMDSLALKYLGHQTIHFEDVAGKGAKQLTFNDISLDVATDYAAEDADVTLKLHQEIWPRLEKLPGQKSIFEEIEIPLIPILSKMECHGVLIDGDELHRQSHDLAIQMAKLEEQAHKEAGHPFNLGSPKQLQQILFEEKGLPVIRKTPKGQPSTAEDVLTELAVNYELPGLVLEFRSLSKLKSTYTDKLPEQINPATGRVHTSYHQAVAATGRLSSSDPNLQNIPIRTAQGRKIRKAFIAPPGQCLMAADYSQIELRIMAHLAQDEGLLKAFRDGVDIHRATAGEVFDAKYDDVTHDQRRSAKAINFGLMYGMSAFGLARQLDINRGEAQEYIDTYFSRYPGVRSFMDKTREQAYNDGYVETLYGRRLWLRDIKARNQQVRQAAERAAINAPLQGTAADIIKRAMIDVSTWMDQEQARANLIMQVHDELVFEVEREILDSFQSSVSRLMEGAAELDIPLVVDIGVGDNWDAAH